MELTALFVVLALQIMTCPEGYGRAFLLFHYILECKELSIYFLRHVEQANKEPLYSYSLHSRLHETMLGMLSEPREKVHKVWLIAFFRTLVIFIVESWTIRSRFTNHTIENLR